MAAVPAFALIVTTLARAQPPARSIAVVPQPVSVTARPGTFTLSAGTTIWADQATADLGRRLSRDLEPATGFHLAVRTTGTPAGHPIVLRRDRTVARLGPRATDSTSSGIA